MNAYELFALDYYLHDYDASMSFDEVLDALTDGDESVTVWQVFEDYPARELIEFITDMVFSVECRFTPKKASK